MNVPTKCPVCGDPLLNSFGIAPEGKSLWKSCNKRLNHNIEFFLQSEVDNRVGRFTIILGKLRVSWWLSEQRLQIIKDGKVEDLPFFEPDLSDYGKLINKLRTYLTFS